MLADLDDLPKLKSQLQSLQEELQAAKAKAGSNTSSPAFQKNPRQMQVSKCAAIAYAYAFSLQNSVWPELLRSVMGFVNLWQ